MICGCISLVFILLLSGVILHIRTQLETTVTGKLWPLGSAKRSSCAVLQMHSAQKVYYMILFCHDLDIYSKVISYGMWYSRDKSQLTVVSFIGKKLRFWDQNLGDLLVGNKIYWNKIIYHEIWLLLYITISI